MHLKAIYALYRDKSVLGKCFKTKIVKSISMVRYAKTICGSILLLYLRASLTWCQFFMSIRDPKCDPVSAGLWLITCPGYWPLIGCWGSRDLDAGLWLAESDHVTWILASDWLSRGDVIGRESVNSLIPGRHRVSIREPPPQYLRHCESLCTWSQSQWHFRPSPGSTSNRPPLSATFLEICLNHEHNPDNRESISWILLSLHWHRLPVSCVGVASDHWGNISQYANMSSVTMWHQGDKWPLEHGDTRGHNVRGHSLSLNCEHNHHIHLKCHECHHPLTSLKYAFCYFLWDRWIYLVLTFYPPVFSEWWFLWSVRCGNVILIISNDFNSIHPALCRPLKHAGQGEERTFE